MVVPPVTYSVVERGGRSTQQASCFRITRQEKAWKKYGFSFLVLNG